MFRLLFVFVLSFAVSSQAVAAVKWNNSSSASNANTHDKANISSDLILMSENFEDKNNLNVDDRNQNWSVEAGDDGNSVYCNKIKNSWTEFNFGEDHWVDYSISYRMRFQSEIIGSVETHIRKRDRKDYRAELKQYGDRVLVRLLNQTHVADVQGNNWLNINLSAMGSTITISVNGSKETSVLDSKLIQGGAMIAVSANSKICVDDIVVRGIGSDATILRPVRSIPRDDYDPILEGHDFREHQKKIASQIVQGLGDKRVDLVIYDGSLFQPPRSLKEQMSDASLEFYYLMQNARLKTDPDEYYIIEGTSNYSDFKNAYKSHKKIDAQLAEGTIFSFLYYANGNIVYDALPPENRFNMKLDEQSYFASHSMGKSITSYLLGHAICKGYIGSIDDAIEDWPLMENTLYYGQPIINLLNMSAGDTKVLNRGTTFIKSGRNIHNGKPILHAVKNENELKNTKPQTGAKYSYSNFTSDVLFNFIAHRVGDNFEQFLTDFYQKKIGIEYPVYLWLNTLLNNATFNVKNLTEQGAWQYGISATRYDYLRIAVAILKDWKNDTCEGKYLKQLYDRSVKIINNSTKQWKKWPGARYPQFNSVANRYAGQFLTGFTGMNKRKILMMSGADGQQILINTEDSTIIVMNAGQAGWYNTKSIAYDLIKSGKIKSGNWN